MRRYITYLWALVLLAAVSCSESKSREDGMPKFEPFEMAVESAECRVSVCYQRITNVEDNPIFADIEAQNYANTFDGYMVEPMSVEASAQLLVDEYSEEGRWNISHSSSPCWYTMDQQVHFVRDNGILCYETYVETYTGGAHGGSSLWYECFDLATGQLYDFTYLFDGEWSACVRELLFDKLLEIEPYTFIESADALPAANSVLVTERGVMFVYQPYAVASFASGIISITLTDEEIATTGAPLVWVVE